MSPRTLLLVDGHVHLHRAHGLKAFLDRAAANLQAAAKLHAAANLYTVGDPHAAGDLYAAAGPHAAENASPAQGVLLFTEGAGVDRFGELARWKGQPLPHAEGWRVEATEEDASLVLHSDGGASLLLVAGRQIRTAPGLEVLAPCTRQRFPDGEGFHETLAQVRAAGGPPVIPWGFGKWWGARGWMVRTAMEAAEPGSLLLGDNGGRPRRAGVPTLVRVARRRGIPVLAGTDPLPFPSEVRRVGGYGSVLTCPDLDPAHPAEAIRRALADAPPVLPTFGRRAGLPRFLWTQARMRAPARDDRARAGEPQ